MQGKVSYIQHQMIQKCQKHACLSEKVYMHIQQMPQILYTLYVNCRFQKELVE